MKTLNWNFLMGPLVGGIIGYITNGIAIKMLFRPLKPIYLLGIRLPFTPGLIPKEKARIAKNIGQVISEELINEEVLSQALLKEEIYNQLRDQIDEIIQKALMDKTTLGALWEQAVGNEKATALMSQVEQKISETMYHKILSLNLGQMAVEKILNELTGEMGSAIFGPLAFLMKGSMIENIGQKIETMINHTIENEGESLVGEIVSQESEKLLEKPVKEVAIYLEAHKEIITEAILKAYKHLVQNKLENALKTLNIAKIVEERINAFDTLELERIILDIMEKELRAIIWLGALLGAIMGCIMNLV